MTRNAVIVDAVRSPMGRGKAGGILSGIHPTDLLADTRLVPPAGAS
jgi:acetyl-CoA acyltransferase